MNKSLMTALFALGLATVGWVGWGFAGSSPLALAMTVLIGAVYVFGAFELARFRQASASLAAALRETGEPPADLAVWLGRLPPALRDAVRQRIEGERVALPGPALTPYLVGLLVMLGMLGTFLGMVVTFKGAVFALQTSSSLEATRAALAAPIQGLGLSFGTSVAGVAASAVLGLLSALSRRERLEAVRLLDARAASVLRPFSASQRRDDMFQALQTQAQAMPLIADRLQGLVDGLERRHEALAAQLQAQQQGFHREATAAYTELARTVGTSLHDSLRASAQVAGDTLRPVVEQAMAALAQDSAQAHQRQADATAAQMQALKAQWEGSAREVAATWTTALQSHRQAQNDLVARLDGALQSVTQSFEQRSSALQAAWQDAAAHARTTHLAADQERLALWQQSMDATAQALATQWQHLGNQAAERQQAQGEQLAALTGVWRTELAALRDAEAERGRAAVDRLDALQAAVAQHLATLGAALEAPLTRLLHTASDVPQAAAGVIAQLRQEMATISERDNAALTERTALMAQLDTLLQSVNEAAVQQRGAIESLVGSAATVLEQAGQQFAQALDAQAGKAGDVATQVAASAVELASLGEAFGHGVGLFTASNDRLMDSLQRIESAIGQSLARSDEQLAYYVAQAREVIDLSLTSQQQIVGDLQRLARERAAEGSVA